MFRSIWPWKKTKPAVTRNDTPWPLSMPLLRFSDNDTFTLGHAIMGVLVLGATGSGKTSGSGRLFAENFLCAGFGGLVLCAKADERRLWEEYCRRTGRSQDLIIFGPDQLFRFNFIQFELTRKGAGAGQTENIINLFMTILEIAERNQGGGGNEENYWRRAVRQLCRNLVDLLIFATGTVSVPELYKLVVSAPTSLEQIESEAWQRQSFCFRCLSEADKRQKTARQLSDFKLVADYFLLEFPCLSEKTRSVIVSSFTSMVDVLNRGLLRELFCGETNITPEAIPKGAIILIDLPVKEFAEIGAFAQVLWKYCFQRSIEQRNISENPRPVFLWQDEAQNFCIENDYSFQATCRSARVSTVVLSQNISNFYAVLGEGQKGKAQADSLFGNLNTKLFHANGDSVTNEWASTMIGKTRQFMTNASSNYQAGDWFGTLTGTGASQGSAGISEQINFEIEPSVFTQLRTGGPDNDWMVDAIIFSTAMCASATGKSWLPVSFRQK